MKKNTQVIEQWVDDELLIIPIVDGVAQMKKVSCLSESGAIIWKIISENEDILEDEVIDKVAQYYQIPVPEIKDDILEFINAMVEQKIIIKEEIK